MIKVHYQAFITTNSGGDNSKYSHQKCAMLLNKNLDGSIEISIKFNCSKFQSGIVTTIDFMSLNEDGEPHVVRILLDQKISNESKISYRLSAKEVSELPFNLLDTYMQAVEVQPVPHFERLRSYFKAAVTQVINQLQMPTLKTQYAADDEAFSIKTLKSWQFQYFNCEQKFEATLKMTGHLLRLFFQENTQEMPVPIAFELLLHKEAVCRGYGLMSPNSQGVLTAGFKLDETDFTTLDSYDDLDLRFYMLDEDELDDLDIKVLEWSLEHAESIESQTWLQEQIKKLNDDENDE